MMMTAAVSESPTLNIFDKTMAISVSIHMLGDTRKVKTEKTNGNSNGDDGPKEEGTLSIDTEADEKLIKVSKKILECEEYSKITSLAGEVKTYLRLKSVPGCSKLIRSGTFLINISILEDVDQKLKEFQEQMSLLSAKFCEVYEARIEEAKKRLKELFCEKDYPTVRNARKSFSIDYEYISIGPPTSLSGINKVVYEREVKKIKDNCAAAALEAQAALRMLFQKLLDHIVECLTPGTDGKKKRLYDSSIGNIKEFLQDFSARNITDDTELAELTAKCRSALEGRTMDQFRQSQSAKELVASRLSKIKSGVDGLVERSVSRKIDLED